MTLAPMPPLRPQGPALTEASPIPLPTAGEPCRQHPQTTAIRRCDRCRSLMCAVCRFEFPGNIHVCPTCVLAPTSPVDGKRVSRAVLGLLASVGSMAFLGAMMSGLMQFESEAAAGFAFTGLIFFPAAIGLTLSYSAMDRNRGNNSLLWTSSVVASLALGICVLLVIIGLTQS